MAVAAVAAAVDHALLCVFRDVELARLIFIQRPQVVLLVKVGLTSSGLILLELLAAVGQELTVPQGLNAYVLLLTGGAIAGEGEHIGLMCYHNVDQFRDLVNVGAGNGSHDDGPDARPLDAGDLLQGAVETAGLAEPVVGLAPAVQGHLVLLTAVLLQTHTHFIVQMEGIAQDGKGDLVFLHQPQQVPEVRMQDGSPPVM